MKQHRPIAIVFRISLYNGLVHFTTNRWNLTIEKLKQQQQSDEKKHERLLIFNQKSIFLLTAASYIWTLLHTVRCQWLCFILSYMLKWYFCSTCGQHELITWKKIKRTLYFHYYMYERYMKTTTTSKWRVNCPPQIFYSGNKTNSETSKCNTKMYLHVFWSYKAFSH